MSTQKLPAEPRTVTGKKVQKLRTTGFIPATVYGKTTQPLSITVGEPQFAKVYAITGETGLIELTIEGKIHPVLVHTVQKDPVYNTVLHIEFHQVDLKEKVHAEIPLEFIGEPLAVKEKLGIFLSLIDHVEVEALPTELPEKIEVDCTHLAAVNDQIVVANLPVPSHVTMLTDGEVIVAKIGAFVVEKEPEAPPVETTPEGTVATPEEEKAPEEKTEQPAE